jgi:hypothetical protein
MEDAQVNTLVRALETEFGGVVDNQTLRAVVEAQARRFDEVSVRDFVPLLVEREVRQALNQIV